MTQMNVRDLYNMITILPEAGLAYLLDRLVGSNQLVEDEIRLLSDWVSKKEKVDRTEVIRKILLELRKSNIKYIANPTEEEQLQVVYSDPYLIEFIDDPSDTVQMSAANHSVTILKKLFTLIKHPCRGLWIKLLGEQPELIATTVTSDEEFQLIAISKMPALIMGNIVPWVASARRLAFEMNPNYLMHLIDQTDDDAWRALEHDIKLLPYVKNPTDEMKSYCVLVS